MSQRQNSPWLKEKVERLIAWMEEHPEALRGKQAAWHRVVKEQVFSDDEDITVKKITEKASNLKTSWKNAHDLQQRSGMGLRSEDQERSFNDMLEKKCAFFWRLDAIWGTRPNAVAIVSTETITQPSSQQPTQQLTQPSPQQPTQQLTQPSPQQPTQQLTQPSSQQPTQQLTQLCDSAEASPSLEVPSISNEISLPDEKEEPELNFDWSPSPPRNIESTPPLIPSRASTSRPSSTSQSTTPLTTLSRQSGKKKKRDFSSIWEHNLDKKVTAQDKRHKAEMEVQEKESKLK